MISYKCPGCSKEIRDLTTICPACGLDLKSLSKMKQLADFYYNEALELAGKGKEKEAVEKLSSAISIQPNDLEAHLFIGRLYARNREYSLAMEHFKNVKKIEPKHISASRYIEKIEKLIKRKREDEELKHPPPPRKEKFPENSKPVGIKTSSLAMILVVFIITFLGGFSLKGIIAGSPVTEMPAEGMEKKALKTTPLNTGHPLPVEAPGENVKSILPTQTKLTVKEPIQIDKAEISLKKAESTTEVPDMIPEVLKRLKTVKFLSRCCIEAMQNKNVIILKGKVLTAYQVQEAVRVIKNIDGVVYVDSSGITAELEEPFGYCYFVKEDDTLWDLSRYYYGNPKYWVKIYRANPHINPEKLVIGQKVILPAITESKLK